MRPEYQTNLGIAAVGEVFINPEMWAIGFQTLGAITTGVTRVALEGTSLMASACATLLATGNKSAVSLSGGSIETEGSL